MKKNILTISAGICLFMFSPLMLANQPSQDYTQFHDIFAKWTEAFNAKKLKDTCALFSPKVKADYQGVPSKNYTAICDGFKTTFADSIHEYHYRFKINDVYHAGNLAVVRITWYLDTYANHQRINVTRDEGIDVLQKTADGKWQIVNYLAYEVSTQKAPVITTPAEHSIELKQKVKELAPTPSIPMI